MTENPTIVRWPTSTDYTQAVQRPDAAFSDAVLKAGAVTFTPLGIPAVASGQNVVVFKMDTSQGQRAVRCFINPPGQGDQRYAALAQYIASHGCRSLSSATWISEGVRAKSRWWPVVVMPWESGRPLNAVAEDLVGQPTELRRLAQNWIDAVHELQAAKIAHGDLQHGNVLVNEDLSIRLVDLDGVWVPNQTTGPPAEHGHPNYQHIGRDHNDWGQYVDSFSALVVYVSLLALAADSGLDRFMGGENLVLVQSDLQRPEGTEAWTALGNSSDPLVRGLTMKLAALCRLPGPPSASLNALLTETHAIDDKDLTVLREPSATRDLATPVLPQANWWEDEKGAVQAEAAPSNNGFVEPVKSPASRTDPSSGRITPGRSGFAVLAQNAAISGLDGGAAAGLLAAGGLFILQDSLPERMKSAPLVVLVGLFLGAVLNGWQALASRGARSAMPKILLGAAVGTAAGTLALAPANGLRKALLQHEERRSVLLVMLLWMITAALVGTLLGLLRSRRAALSGLLGGLLGGIAGGLLHGATTAEFNNSNRLLLEKAPWATTFITAAVASIVGISIGLVSRAMRFGSLTVIEGRGKDIEVLIDRSAVTIGVAPRSTMRLSATNGVVATHATLNLAPDGTTAVVLAGPTTINGERIDASESKPVALGIESGAVLQIGESFIRFERLTK